MYHFQIRHEIICYIEDELLGHLMSKCVFHTFVASDKLQVKHRVLFTDYGPSTLNKCIIQYHIISTSSML